MYLIRCKPEIYGTPTKEMYGAKFVNGYAFIERHYDYRFFVERDDFEDVTPPDFISINNECKKILVRVPGGVGDSLFATPLLDGIREKYGADCLIEVYGDKNALEILAHNPNIKKFHTHPKMYFEKSLNDYDDIFDLGMTIENNPDSDFKNAYELTSEMFQIKAPDLNPIVYITPEEQKHAKEVLASLEVPQNEIKIGVHLESTSILRAFPRKKVLDLLDELSKYGHVFMFSVLTNNLNRQRYTCPECKVEDTVVIHDHVKKLQFKCSHCGYDKIELEKEPCNPKVHHIVGSHLRLSASLVNEMHAMVCIDSGLLHIAAGLEKPIVALFAAFDGALRTKYFNNCVTINAPYRCAPCQLNNVNFCPPMGREKLSEPPCIQGYEVKEVSKWIKYILDQNGKDFKSIHVNPPPEVKFYRKECLLCGCKDYNILGRKGDVAHARCLNCESIFCLSDFDYSKYSEEKYHDIFFTESIERENIEIGKNLSKKLNGLIGTDVGNRVLEIGCSNGRTLKGFYDAGWIPYGIEPSQRAVDAIQENWKKNIFVGDLDTVLAKHAKSTWNWPGRSLIKEIKEEDETVTRWLRTHAFECVLLQHTFEHFNEPQKAFRQATNMVGDKGFLVIIGPSASAMNPLGTCKNIHLNTFWPGEHVLIPSKKAMISLAHENGLTIVSYTESTQNSSMVCIMRKN